MEHLQKACPVRFEIQKVQDIAFTDVPKSHLTLPEEQSSSSMPISLGFLGWKITLSTIFFGLQIFSFACRPNDYFLFATNLSFLVQTGLYFFWTIYLVKQYRLYRSNANPADNDPENVRTNCAENLESSLLGKLLYNILSPISYIVPIQIMLGYWIFVYNGKSVSECARIRSHYIAHSGVAVIAVIDFVISAVPLRTSSCLLTSFSCVTYLAMTWFYELTSGLYDQGKDYIYPFLNWKHKPWKTLLLAVFLSLISLVSSFIISWILKKSRWTLNHGIPMWKNQLNSLSRMCHR